MRNKRKNMSPDVNQKVSTIENYNRF